MQKRKKMELDVFLVRNDEGKDDDDYKLDRIKIKENTLKVNCVKK